MKTLAIIQVRMGSTRLPGKSLMEISGRPLIDHVVERTRAARTVDRVVIATTTEAADQPLVGYAAGKGIRSYQGSRDDVLDRFYQAALPEKPEYIVRITADDPFKDPAVIDRITTAVINDPSVDYASNTLKPTFPEGIDVEAFRFRALETTWREAALASEREHVTPFIWKRPERFRLRNILHTSDLSALRWTIDYPEDMEFARAVYARLSPATLFGMGEILALLEREPELQRINEGFTRNAGYLKSLKNDNTK